MNLCHSRHSRYFPPSPAQAPPQHDVYEFGQIWTIYPLPLHLSFCSSKTVSKCSEAAGTAMRLRLQVKALEFESQLLQLLRARACPQVRLRVPGPPHPSHGANHGHFLMEFRGGGYIRIMCAKCLACSNSHISSSLSSWRVGSAGLFWAEMGQRRPAEAGACGHGPGPARPDLGNNLSSQSPSVGLVCVFSSGDADSPLTRHGLQNCVSVAHAVGPACE